MENNNSPLLPEIADAQESEFELEAARWNYDQTLRALGRNLDDPLLRADFETARDDLCDAERVMARAQERLNERAREFARLNASLGGSSDGRDLRAKMDDLGFGGDDWGLDARAQT